MITSVKEVMDFVYASYFARQDVASESPSDGSHPMDDRNKRRPELAKQILESLGQPDAQGINILVTGSKGKGSVSRILDLILRAHKFKVGLFTSPHLHVYNERISINGTTISDDDLIDMANLVAPISSKIQAHLNEGDYISPMANGLGLALTYFKHMETDFNILECGRGARFDDVAVAKADYAVINVIFDEHIPYLGQSIEDVAWYKAGVMKSGQKQVFSAIQKDVVKDILLTESKLRKTKLTFTQDIQEDILNHVSQSYNQANANLAYQAAQGILGQAFNHDLAMKAIKSYGFSGCLEQVSSQPKIFMDGCIHPVCAKEIANSINGKSEKRAIIGVPDNKSYKELVRELLGVMDCIILSEPSNCHLPFGGEQIDFANEVGQEGFNIYHIKSLEEAIETSLSDLPEAGEVFIIGTQIYLGQVKSILKRRGLI